MMSEKMGIMMSKKMGIMMAPLLLVLPVAIHGQVLRHYLC